MCLCCERSGCCGNREKRAALPWRWCPCRWGCWERTVRWAEPGSLWLDSYSSSPGSVRSSPSGTPASTTAPQTHTSISVGTTTRTSSSATPECVRVWPGSSSACSSVRGLALWPWYEGPGRQGRWRRGLAAAEGSGTWARQPWWGRRGRQCIAATADLHSTYSEQEGALPGLGPDSEFQTPEEKDRDKNTCVTPTHLWLTSMRNKRWQTRPEGWSSYATERDWKWLPTMVIFSLFEAEFDYFSNKRC